MSHHYIPVIMREQVTCVDVKFMGAMRTEDRKLFIISDSALDDAQEELRLSDEIENGQGVNADWMESGRDLVVWKQKMLQMTPAH